jgi:hypothetical protein
MTLTELRTLFRIQVPMAKASGIDDAALDVLLNQAPDEINLIAQIYKGYSDFQVSINDLSNSLPAKVPTYMGMAKGGIFYQDSASNWVQIYPQTKAWFDTNIPNYQNSSAGIPQYYYVEDDVIVWDRPWSAVYTVRIYHLKKATAMSSGSVYPWSGSATQNLTMRPMDNAIVAYAKWRVQPALGKDEQGNYRGGSTYNEFIAEVRMGSSKIRRRPDLYAQSTTRMNI